MIRGSAETLLVVINDLLDVSKIEANRMHLEEAPLNLRAIIQQNIGPLRLQAEAKGLRVTTLIDLNIPAILVGDSVRIRQVFTNLISNAIKFTEAGSVEVDVRSFEHVGQSIVLKGCVKDTGIGIASDRSDPFQGTSITVGTYPSELSTRGIYSKQRIFSERYAG